MSDTVVLAVLCAVALAGLAFATGKVALVGATLIFWALAVFFAGLDRAGGRS